MAKLHKEPNWKPVDIDRAREKVRNRVYRVGIELEGGWDQLPAPTNRLAHDGSVQFGRRPGETMPRYHGEMPSGVLDVVKSSPTYWGSWVRANYPQHVNDTCGMHVHLSFKTAFAYNRIMRAEYPATVVEEFKKWSKREDLAAEHPIWNRLAGKCRYCQLKFDADNQVINRDKDHNQDRAGHRYTVINYCWARYNTAECRLLPMMVDAPLATRAIQELIDVTNAFLLATGKREERLVAGHAVDEGMEQVETRIFV